MLLIKKACICKNFPDFRYSQYRPSCIQDVSSSPNLHGMEARTEKSRNQCHVLTISKMFPYAFPLFSLILRVLSKQRKIGIKTILVVRRWQSQAWYTVLMSMCIHSLIRRTYLWAHEKKIIPQDCWPGWFSEIIGIKRHFRQSCKAYTKFQKRKFNLFLRINLKLVGQLVQKTGD